LSPRPPDAPPTDAEFDALLRLLDDETPEVRSHVAARLARLGGDLSERLIVRGRVLEPDDQALLSQLTAPARRETLVREWAVPTGGAAAMLDDWDTLEALLRFVSDFLHDGVTVRQPLSDALDLVSDEAAAAGVSTPDALRVFLFGEGGRFGGDPEPTADRRHADLAWVVATGQSDPLGYGLLFLLVARRLDLEVEGLDFSDSFVCRIHIDGRPFIVECHAGARLHSQEELLESGGLSREVASRLTAAAATPGRLLLAFLENLLGLIEWEEADEHPEAEEDAALIRRLRESLD
jgi:hypothetical protein